MQRIQILAKNELRNSNAVAAALDRLKEIGSKYRVSFNVGNYEKIISTPNSIVITISSEETADWLKMVKDKNRYTLPSKPDGFGIWNASDKQCLLFSSTIRGIAYALYYIADRINVTGRLPKESITLDPAFEDRFILSLEFPDADIQIPPYVSSEKLVTEIEKIKKKITDALSSGATHIVFSPTYRLVKWEDEIEDKRNEYYRDGIKEVIQYAKNLGLKVLTMGDEFIYTENLLKKFDAELSIENKNFWEAVKYKFRTLLTDFNELDGVAVRIGEIIPYGNLRVFDVINNESNLSLEEKYRRFIQNVYDVVAGEFGKIYYHRTWATSEWEVHSVPRLYERIFSKLPVENLYVSIKLTKTDQWNYQAFNPTIGLSSHKTIVELEISKGEHGSQRYPDFMGLYQSAGLQYAKIKGAAGAAGFFVQNSFWRDASFYAGQRLMWNPNQDVKTIAQDWATARFGRRTSKNIAAILMISYNALMKSLYLKPYASTHAWNPLPHIKTDRYSLEGDPVWDKGKTQMNFLYELYLQCKPWLEETINEMNEGEKLYDKMMEIFYKAKPSIDDPQTAKRALESLRLGQTFVKLSVLYSTSFLRFFEFKEIPAANNKLRIKQLIKDLKTSLKKYHRFKETFDTLAIEQFIVNAEEFLINPKKAEDELRNAPDEKQVREILKSAGEKDEIELQKHPDAVKVFSWYGNVDGKDLLIMKGRTVKLKHLSYSPPTEVKCDIFSEVPKNSKLVVQRIEARGFVCVAEQPCKENKWSSKIYISDPQSGKDIYKFNVYAVNGAGVKNA